MNGTTDSTPHIQGGKGLLPYHVIVSAVSGDVDAMNTVLNVKPQTLPIIKSNKTAN